MDFRALSKMLLQGWHILALGLLIGTLAGFTVTRMATKTYESSGLLYISSVRAEDPTGLAQGTRYIRDQMKSYTTLLTSPSVLAGVIAQRQAQTTPYELSKRISVDVPLDTTLMRITVSSESPEDAQQTADTLITRFIDNVQRLERRTDTQASMVDFTVIDRPSLPRNPSSPSLRTNILLGTVGGFLLGVVGVALRASWVEKRKSKPAEKGGLASG